MEQVIAAIAAKIVCQHGEKSLQVVAEYSQMANAIGDQASVQTWRDIASGVERLLVHDGIGRRDSHTI